MNIIVDPNSHLKYSIFSQKGKALLKSYIKMYQSGGNDALATIRELGDLKGKSAKEIVETFANIIFKDGEGIRPAFDIKQFKKILGLAIQSHGRINEKLKEEMMSKADNVFNEYRAKDVSMMRRQRDDQIEVPKGYGKMYYKTKHPHTHVIYKIKRWIPKKWMRGQIHRLVDDGQNSY